MDNLEFKGAWNDIKGKLKTKYAELTDDDLLYAEGQEDQMLGKIQKRIGQSKEQVRDLIRSL